MSEFDLDAINAFHPDEQTAAVVAEAAAIAAAEVAGIVGGQHAAEMQRLQAGQAESALLTAVNEVSGKYGIENWERTLPRIQERLAASPNLIPPEARTSPGALSRALEDVYRLAAADAAEEDKRNQWERIKAAGPSNFRVYT